MNLFYWNSPAGNFGDDLNEWLWDDLLPGWRSWAADRTLLGVGTILNARHLADNRRYLVCGSGAGIGEPPDVSDRERWRIAFVRGRRTAALMSISDELAMSDPAIVVPRIARFAASAGARNTIFIPHCHTDASPIYDWKRICTQAGVEHVSPRRDSHRVIRAISSAESVITESMHGAIIADAFRVPWKPVSLVANFCSFKWMDWGDGLDLQFEIAPLPNPLFKKHFLTDFLEMFSPSVGNANDLRPGPQATVDALRRVDLKKTNKKMTAAILALKEGEFYLSENAKLCLAQEKVLERLRMIGAEYG